MLRTLLSAALVAASSPAAVPAQAYAEYCADLWIVRNAAMDRAGFCFGSVLGQAAFDNSDCSGKNPPLSPSVRTTVRQAREGEAGTCRIDNTRVDPTVMRRLRDFAPVIAMDDIPVPDFLAWGCLGYRGSESVLRAGRSPAARPTARLAPGDDLIFNFVGAEGWSFAQIDATGAVGWMPNPSESDCAQVAG